MEVRCSRCSTDYVFDGSRVGPRGVSVKCAACGHVFRVYRPEEGPRQWQVRHADGRRVEFKELTTLQRWIVEGRIKRDHEISRGGGTWKSLGEIKELEPFFDVVERAERAERTSGDLLSAPIAPMSSDRSSALRSHIYSPAELEPIREAARQESEANDTEPNGNPRPSVLPPPEQFPTSFSAEITGDAPRPPGRGGGVWAALVVLLLVGASGLVWWSSGRDTKSGTLPPAARRSGSTPPAKPMTDAAPAPEASSEMPREDANPSKAASTPVDPPPEEIAKAEPTPAQEASSLPREPALRRESRRAASVGIPEMLAVGRRALADQGWSDALDAFGRASELSPQLPEPHAGKGSAYLGMGRADLALDAYRTALRLDPDFVSARLGVGRALLSSGDEENARLAIRAFLKRAPENHPEREAAQTLLQPGP
ncbi:MAG: zinc-ribbon domain-containing protein [Myxococcota bacterium]